VSYSVDRVREAAREGRIGFYEGTDKTEEHDGMIVEYRHGVCAGCVWDASDTWCPPKPMCGGDQMRVATIEEVEKYLSKLR